MIGEAQYIAALSEESPFFSGDSDKGRSDSQLEQRWESESLIPTTWNITRRTPWTYAGPARERMLVGGWKMHVSATPDGAGTVLSTVIRVCCSHNVSFKFLGSRRQFLQANSEQAPRSGSGKFITIYPDSNDTLDELVNELYPLLRNQKGPYILSDVRYLDSPIFFRYGGFVNIQYTDETGIDVSAVPGIDGLLGEDKRLPGFVTPPEGISTPNTVRRAISDYMTDSATDLDHYSDMTPLHFSNSGGVYQAKNARGQVCLLKEARPYAGLDGRQRDAVERLNTEWQILNAVSSTGFTPHPYGIFDAWEHRYIEMEYIEGVTLNNWLATNYPYQWQNGKPHQLAEYRQSIISYGQQILSAVTQIHKTGYVHGDIHLGNIMVNPTVGTINFIDFEDGRRPESRKVTPHNALGFQAPDTFTAEEADWFAVAKTLAALCYPNSAIAMLSPEHWKTTLQLIDVTFGHEFSDLIRQAEDHCPKQSSAATVPFTPRQHPLARKIQTDSHEPNQDSRRTRLKRDVIKGIYAARHAVVGRLFPCDAPNGNALMSSNIDTGAAGVLLSLYRSGEQIGLQDFQWTKDTTVSRIHERAVDRGLYTGLSGIGMLSLELGDVDFAKELLDIVSNRLPENRSMNLADGLAGQVLSLLDYCICTGDDRYSGDIRDAITIIEDRLMNGKSPALIKSMNGKGGLYHGWSGIALMWMALSHFDMANADKFAGYAVECLNKDLATTVVSDDGVRGTLDKFNRSLPYFADGTAGILTAACIARLALGDDSLFSPQWDSLKWACCSSMYAFSGLNRGVAGIIVADQFASFWSPELIPARDRLIASLDTYALDWFGTLQFPGDSYLRLSSDYSTGAAGILTMLNTVDHDPWDFLPLVNVKDVFLGPAKNRKPPKGGELNHA